MAQNLEIHADLCITSLSEAQLNRLPFPTQIKCLFLDFFTHPDYGNKKEIFIQIKQFLKFQTLCYLSIRIC